MPSDNNKDFSNVTAIEHVGHGVVIDRRAGQYDRVIVDGKVVSEHFRYSQARDRAAKEVSKKLSK